MIPAILLGLALAIGGLKLYGTLTRPAVSAEVQGIVQNYTARGVRLGATVGEVKAVVHAPLRFVPHVGFVANPRDRTGVSQLRLLLSARDRDRKGGDGDRVEAIELVTAAENASTALFSDLTVRFRAVPRVGCVSVGGDEYHREVHWWTAPDDRGGVAVLSGFGGDRSFRHPGQVVVSLLAFGGKFQGGATLRANYAAQSCAQLVGARQPDDKEAARAAAASDSLTLAFGDTAAGGAPGARPATVATSFEDLDPCTDRVRGDDFTLRKTTLVDLYVPPGFEPVGADESEREAVKTGYAQYTWRSADYAVITISPGAVGGRHQQRSMGIVKECDLSTAGAQLHVDIGFIGRGHGVRGVFMFPSSMALIFEGQSQSPERMAQMLHSLRTLFISPRWGARP
jgi:hypothetical protein